MRAQITAKGIGALVRKTRKHLGVTQKSVALTSGTGLRFIIELERGKPSCQLSKVLTVLQTLGIELKLKPPGGDQSGNDSEHGTDHAGDDANGARDADGTSSGKD